MNYLIFYISSSHLLEYLWDIFIYTGRKDVRGNILKTIIIIIIGQIEI